MTALASGLANKRFGAFHLIRNWCAGVDSVACNCLIVSHRPLVADVGSRQLPCIHIPQEFSHILFCSRSPAKLAAPSQLFLCQTCCWRPLWYCLALRFCCVDILLQKSEYRFAFEVMAVVAKE